MTDAKTVAIVGAGPVGSLAALYFANEGWNVSLYDRRNDPRLEKVQGSTSSTGKSINLALSHRGIEGLKGASMKLSDMVTSNVVPVYGRMIHDTKGRQESQPYDVHGQHINAVDRGWLNVVLLDEIDERPNVELKFGHRLLRCDFDAKRVKFITKDGEVDVNADLVVGADGAHSAVRNQLMRAARVDFEQKYIDALWCEISIPARVTEHGREEYPLDPNHLHIWPRKTFMLMSLANIGDDKSFTGTLFMPQSNFDDITYPQDLLDFFRTHFPDVIPLIGEEYLVQQFFSNPKGSLVSIKCTPYHYLDRCVLIGDAAHAMVPFYGQGMNCGFEDVQQLFMHLKANNTVYSGLETYTLARRQDLFAISDLAMANYVEMRSSVTSKMYLARKHTEEFLYKYFPGLGVRTLYNMVSFSSVPYHIALKRSIRQGQIFRGACFGVGLGIMGVAVYGVLRFKKIWQGWVWS
ncbi:hypothetical protein POJ06DRAFT_264716 [Lipomyces tetrasporus]|uniref:Kynurenine 3-monooxygenase n=1 Tax=Lipomyces tetrasporus TaxID=54092 RepID=A0AAD7VVU2_9ASCO|nr:uncharacterized protein POJ06DRAFT_264716 [Lipomyces tetrasporus]KAJ8103883.1 hypothetical protein POJ06DRAFT_264716 [Lipomyces tetrasporus]